jgi:hypothetical protein
MILTPVFEADGSDLILSFSEFSGQGFNLSTLQKSNQTIIRIYQDEAGEILDESGFWLVAEINIPCIAYHAEPVLDEFGQQVLDENGLPETQSVLSALAENDINITLWKLPEGEN